MGFLYIAGCIVFTVYGQLVLKWRMNMQAPLPDGVFDKSLALVKLIIFDPFVLSGFISAFLASLFWMAAMSRRMPVRREPLLMLPAVANRSPRFSRVMAWSRRNSATMFTSSLRL